MEIPVVQDVTWLQILNPVNSVEEPLQRFEATADVIRDQVSRIKIGDMKAIDTILHHHLNIRKLCSCWIPHNLIKAQKQVHAQEIQSRSVKFGLQYRYWRRNVDLLFGYFKVSRNRQSCQANDCLLLIHGYGNRGFRGLDCKC